MYLLRAALNNVGMQWLKIAFSTFTEFTTQSMTKGKVILLCKLNVSTKQKFIGDKCGNKEDVNQLNHHGVIQTIHQLRHILQGHSVPAVKKPFQGQQAVRDNQKVYLKYSFGHICECLSRNGMYEIKVMLMTETIYKRTEINCL